MLSFELLNTSSLHGLAQRLTRKGGSAHPESPRGPVDRFEKRFVHRYLYGLQFFGSPRSLFQERESRSGQY
jgi:hypothetical protein